MRVVVSEFISLDGVVQAPGGPDEDTSGGFGHGGWSMRYFDPKVMGAVIDEFAERSDALLQGRRTYRGGSSLARAPSRRRFAPGWANHTRAGVLLAPSERAVVEVLFDRPGGLKLQHRISDRAYRQATVTVTEEQATQLLAGQFEAQEVSSGKTIWWRSTG